MRTGWRRLIGSPKLQIIFHKRATKYRSLLRKMTYKDKGSYESSPPCIHLSCDTSQRNLRHEWDAYASEARMRYVCVDKYDLRPVYIWEWCEGDLCRRTRMTKKIQEWDGYLDIAKWDMYMCKRDVKETCVCVCTLQTNIFTCIHMTKKPAARVRWVCVNIHEMRLVYM